MVWLSRILFKIFGKHFHELKIISQTCHQIEYRCEICGETVIDNYYVDNIVSETDETPKHEWSSWSFGKIYNTDGTILSIQKRDCIHCGKQMYEYL